MLSLAFLPLAAALPENSCCLEHLGPSLSVMLLVFLVLASVWIVVDLVDRFRKLGAPTNVPTLSAPSVASVPVAVPMPAAIAAGASTPAADLGVAPETAAVIVAAVHSTLGSNARVAQIVPIMTNTWARDGRRQIFSSHQLR